METISQHRDASGFRKSVAFTAMSYLKKRIFVQGPVYAFQAAPDKQGSQQSLSAIASAKAEDWAKRFF